VDLVRKILKVYPEYTLTSSNIIRIIENNGPIYLKRVSTAVKTWAYRLLAGDNQLPADLRGVFRCKKYKGKLIPVLWQQPFKDLVRFAFLERKSSPRRIQKTLGYLNAHFCIPDDRKLSSARIHEAITAPPVKIPVLYRDLINVRSRVLPIFVGGPTSECYITSSKVAITATKTGWYHEYLMHYYGLSYRPQLDESKKITSLTQVESMVDAWIGIFDAMKKVKKAFKKPKIDPIQGILKVIIDRNNKARAVMIGNASVQASIDPLKDYLFALLRLIPSDCTYDQTEGVEFVRKSMRKGKKIFSVDTKDWTYHFPIELQELVLNNIRHRNGEVILQAAKNCLKMPLKCTICNGSHVGLKGSAMGLGISWPLAALTHHLLLMAFCHRCKVHPEHSYRMLGDDIVITDERVYILYIQFCSDCGIPISKGKTFESYSLAEFAGQIVFKGELVTPPRWRSLTETSLPYLYPRYKKILGKAVLSLFQGAGTLLLYNVLKGLHKDFGGFGEPERIVSYRIVEFRVGFLKQLYLSLLAGEPSPYVRYVPDYRFPSRLYEKFIRDLDWDNLPIVSRGDGMVIHITNKSDLLVPSLYREGFGSHRSLWSVDLPCLIDLVSVIPRQHYVVFPKLTESKEYIDGVLTDVKHIHLHRASINDKMFEILKADIRHLQDIKKLSTKVTQVSQQEMEALIRKDVRYVSLKGYITYGKLPKARQRYKTVNKQIGILTVEVRMDRREYYSLASAAAGLGDLFSPKK
jgi:hypothetical protein